MVARWRMGFASLIGAILVGCASASSSSSGDAQKVDQLVPPQMSPNGPISFRGQPRGGTIRIEMPIDADGRADLLALRITGGVSSTTRDDIKEYLSRATFRPAMRAGVPVAGTFVMTMKLR